MNVGLGCLKKGITSFIFTSVINILILLISGKYYTYIQKWEDVGTNPVLPPEIAGLPNHWNKLLKRGGQTQEDG